MQGCNLKSSSYLLYAIKYDLYTINKSCSIQDLLELFQSRAEEPCRNP